MLIKEEESHKLFFDDSENVLKNISDDSIDLIFTDPPYGISFKSGRQCVDREKSVRGEGSIVCRKDYFDPIVNDDCLNINWIEDAYRVLKTDCAMYIFTHWKTWSELYKKCIKSGFSVNGMIVLNKSNHGMGNLKHYAPKHELLLFATKGRHALRFPRGREKDVWNVGVKFSGSRKFHPNEKPFSWIIPAIENSSDVGQIVLDPFMGSGTTGIVAVSMNRKFIGCEKDIEYFNVSVQRIEQSLNQRQSNIL